MHFRKIITTFHKNHLKTLIATFLPLDSAPLIARPLVLKELKQKYGYPSKKTNKRGRN